jgi:hypothetical protein
MVRKLFYLIAIFALVTMACSFSIGTDSESTPVVAQPEPTNPPAPTDPPAPTATTEPTDEPMPTLAPATEAPATEAPATEAPVVFESEAFYQEEFETETADYWSWWLTLGDDRDVDIYTENGYLVTELNANDTYLYLTYDEYTYTDVGVAVVFENRGVNNNNVSLVCRLSDDDGWYEFNVASNGLYDILRWDQRNNKYVTIASGGSNSINQGKDENAYGATCVDDELTLFINGTKVKTVTDRNLREGLVGIGVASFNVSPVVVEVDAIEIFEP